MLICMHSLQSKFRLAASSGAPAYQEYYTGCRVNKQFQEGKSARRGQFYLRGDGPVERSVKHPRESHAESVHILMPGDINGDGRLFGGQLMQWIDIVAAVVARRHSGRDVTTACIDRLEFLHPALVNSTLTLIGRITYVGRTSMEVRVDSFVEALSGERHLVNVAYLVMVAIDEKGNPAVVPALAPETAEEQALFEAGRERARLRKARTAGA